MSQDSQDSSATPSQGGDSPSRRRIRIGSQRSAADFDRARQAELRRAPDEGESETSDKAPAPVEHQAATPVASDVPSEPAASVSESPTAPPKGKPHRKESQKEPRSQEPAGAPQRIVRSVDPASIGDDLDREIAEALGDASIDDIMAQSAGIAAEEELPPETRRSAVVVRVHRDDVFFSLGARHEGVAPLRQFAKPPGVGDRLDVVVTGFHADDGLYAVGLPGASVDVSGWEDLAEGAVVEARVTGANTGGLECQVGGQRGFIPASQVGLYRVENLPEYIGQKLACIVTEANAARGNLVLSHRGVLEREQEQARRELFEKLEVGEVREGVVRNVRDFGAFVDVGGVDGLVHVSKLSWDRVDHPSQVLTEGQKVRVKIDKIDTATGKISLSYRDTLENPWTRATEKYPPGAVAAGTVTRLAKFGAFVKLEPGVEGLIHISELAHQHVRSVGAVLKEGQEVSVKVLTVDPEAQRISLSLKALQAAPQAQSEAADEAEQATDATAQTQTAQRRDEPLKGGFDRPTGGDKFGLNW